MTFYRPLSSAGSLRKVCGTTSGIDNIAEILRKPCGLPCYPDSCDFVYFPQWAILRMALCRARSCAEIARKPIGQEKLSAELRKPVGCTRWAIHVELGYFYRKVEFLERHWIRPDARRILFGDFAKFLHEPETLRARIGNLAVFRCCQLTVGI